MSFRRFYHERLNPTPYRVTALYALIDNGHEMNLNDLHPLTGFCDVRVLLLSLAECALYGLIEIDDNRTVRITSKGVVFAHENVHQILKEYREHRAISGD